MPYPEPPPGFQLDGAPAAGAPPLGRPILRRAPEQPKPQGKVVQNGYVIDPNTASAVPVAGLPPKAAEGGDDIKIQQKRASLQSLETQINRVEELYRGGLKNEAFGILSSLGEFLPTEKNKQFDAASAGLAEQGLSAFRVPGVGAQSDTELRQFVQANKPSASDYDATIEEKLRQLRTRVDATRSEMGLPPAEWLGEISAPAPAQTVPVPGGDLPPPAPAVVPSQSGFKSVIDPQQQALAGTIGSLIAQGADRATILRAAIAGGMNKDDPKFLQFAREIDGAIRFRKSPDWQKWQRLNKGKPYPISPEFYTREEQLTPPEQLLNQAAQSSGGSFVAGAADTLSGGTLDEIIGMTGGDAETARRAQAMIAQENPTANFLGNVTGGTLAALSGEGALARFGFGPGVGRALAADTGFGAAYGAGSAEEGNRLQGAAFGAGAGAAGNVVGRSAANTLGRITAGVSSPEVRALVKDKIPLTIGQAVGKSGRIGSFVKGTEDRIAGVGLDGGVINARRAEGLDVMNAKTFDKALEPINKTVGELTGEEAVAQAQDHVSDAFTDALRGKSAAVDRSFITEAASAKRAIQALPRLAEEVESSIDEVVNSYFDPSGNISGENMQALLQELGKIKRGYQGDPLGHRVGKAVDQVEKAVENLFRRQAPDVMPKYDAAKKAFRRLSIVEDAVLRGHNTGGKFTPAQLGMADRANAKKYSGSHAAAAGKSEFHDFQRNAQEVLPNQVPDSGTAGRLATLAVPATIAGSGAGVGFAAGDAQSGAGTGLTLAGLLALAYTKTGQRALVAAATKRGPKAQKAGKFLKDRARLIGASGATTGALGTSPDR